MGPLQGVRIIEFDGLGPVPFCGMLLAGLGAEVLRITRAGAASAYADVGGAVLHRGRAEVAANLKSPEDRAAVLRLIASADALIEGNRPGVMERLGLGPEACHAINPRLVYGRMTGWGQHGPLAARAGHDINYIALTGVLHAIGTPGEPPVVPLNLVGDYGGGAMFLAVGVLSGVLRARATRQGRVVDAAMTDGSALLMSLFHGLSHAGQWQDARAANLLDGGAPFYRCYRCGDGRDVAVGALEPQFFAELMRVLDIDWPAAQQNDRSRWPEMQAALAAAFATRSRDAWEAAFEGVDACVTPVLSLTEAPEHPHNRARGTFASPGGVTQATPAPRSNIEAAPIAPASCFASLQEACGAWSAPTLTAVGNAVQQGEQIS